MTLWIILTIMTTLAAVGVAAPFLRRLDARRDNRNEDVGVYQDQLREIEREEKSGLIEADSAAQARREIARRLITAERAPQKDGTLPLKSDRSFAAIGVASVIAIGSTILYANIGSPELLSQAAAGRAARATVQNPPEPTAQANPGEGDVAAPVGVQNGDAKAAGTVETMIERLARRLSENPKNPDGWRMLGWSYFSQQRFAEAAAAYATAIEQNPNAGALKTARGEALVQSASGVVSDEAASLFDQALKQDSKDPRARFFAGLKKEQAGAKARALNDWIALLNDTDTKEPFVEDLSQRVVALAGELKVDISSRLLAKAEAATPARGGVLDTLESAPPVMATAALPEPAPAAGPNADDVNKAEAMSSEDRNAMIRGMVDGLQARLEKSPRDADGWIKLIRSRKVLGDDAAAKTALGKAVSAFSDAPAESSRIVAAAKELGVSN